MKGLSTPQVSKMIDSTKCGVFLLINKLIATEQKKKKKIAQKLLSKAETFKVTVLPSCNEEVESFVEQMVEEAKSCSLDENEPVSLQVKAHALKGEWERLSRFPISQTTQKFSETWEAFTRLYLKQQLNTEEEARKVG